MRPPSAARRRAVAVFFLAAVLPASVHAQSVAESPPAPSPPAVVAFEDVTVVPMDGVRVLERQTVIVRDGRIVEMGDAGRVKPPAGALRVDGRRKFLMPGLAEMHGHLPGPQVKDEDVQDLLFLFVANGVTTVRGMLGAPNHLALRERAARGEIVAPTLYLAGPALSGQSVKTPEDGVRLVKEQKAAGFDLLKVHEGLSREAYDAIVATARSEGIPFAGHVAEKVGLRRALEARQATIEHLDGYLEEMEKDESKIPELARATVEAGVWNVPTMALWQALFGDAKPETLRQRPELKYVTPATVEQWTRTRQELIAAGPGPGGEGQIPLRDKLLKGLVEGGARVLLGSDAPQLFQVPGFSLHREMAAMVKAGVSPYHVLRSGTRSVAEHFGAVAEFGTVAVGRRADLILVDGNPLLDVAHAARRSGVMVRGLWLPEAEIQKRLEAIAAARQKAP